jgi:Complex I intermediate-associated protein 30 (CIA30)
MTTQDRRGLSWKTTLVILLLLKFAVASDQGVNRLFLKLRNLVPVLGGSTPRREPAKTTIYMGQSAVRIMKYDRAANERNAVPALRLAGHTLHWFRLDDGVMGGQSETQHKTEVTADGSPVLHFAGTINTEGGGFTSIRTRIPAGLLDSKTQAIRLRFQGDGKTYKLFLTDGNRTTGGPMSRTPSWQADVPTRRIEPGSSEWEDATVPLSSLLPNFGGSVRSRPPEEEKKNYSFDHSSMQEIGLMLSLKLANGKPNPKETFGEGIFPFSLRLQSMESVQIVG